MFEPTMQTENNVPISPLAQARDALARHIVENMDSLGMLSEDDGILNQRSRRVIAAMKEERGAAWLGLFNRNDEEKQQLMLWEWQGEFVYNFGASFVLPAYDADLAHMLHAREAAPCEGPKIATKLLDAIRARIKQLGGAFLEWS